MTSQADYLTWAKTAYQNIQHRRDKWKYICEVTNIEAEYAFQISAT